MSVCLCVFVSRLCHLQAVWLFSQESYPLCASVSLPVKQVTGQYLEGDTRQFASSPLAKATEVLIAEGSGSLGCGMSIPGDRWMQACTHGIPPKDIGLCPGCGGVLWS